VYLLPKDWNYVPGGPLSPQEVAKRKKAKKTIIEDDGLFYEVIPNQDSWYPWDGLGFVVYEYDHEMMPVYTRPGRSYTRTEMMRNWGITAKSVAERVGIVIKPPKLMSAQSSWGVRQTGSRGSLQGPNETPIPLEDWNNEFFAALQSAPEMEFLRKALAEAHPRKARKINPDDVRRMRTELRGRLNLQPRSIMVESKKLTTVKAENEDDEQVLTLVPNKSPKPHPLKPHPQPQPHQVVRPGKGKHAKTVSIEMAPDYEFLTENEWAVKAQAEPDEYKPGNFAVVETDASGVTIYFNMGHDIYVTQRTLYTGPYFKDNPTALRRIQLSDIENVIQNVYATLGLNIILYAEYMATVKEMFDRNEFRRLTEPDRMTLALSGFYNADYAIRSAIGHL
jgi:hypothetical protein